MGVCCPGSVLKRRPLKRRGLDHAARRSPPAAARKEKEVMLTNVAYTEAEEFSKMGPPLATRPQEKKYTRKGNHSLRPKNSTK